MRLAQKVVLVTGGGRGIGRAICRAMAKEGAHVAVAEIDSALGRETIGLLGAAPEAAFVQTDVTSPTSCRRAVEETVARFGRLDVLVNNAGRLLAESRQTLDVLDEQEWDKTMAVNIRGAYSMCRAAAAVMVRQKRGCIVSIASTGSQIFAGEAIAYDVSKGGIRVLTGALAVALGPHGVRVNAVAPGIVVTEARPRLTATGGVPPQAEIAKRIPLRKLAVPEDVACAVVFLASEEAGHITGQTLVVDGGTTILRPYGDITVVPPW